MLGKHSILAVALCIASLASLGTCQVNPAPQCDEAASAACQLPSCRCSGIDIPGGLNSGDIPQLVYITFDDAVTIDNMDFYRDVLYGRKNPNDEPITGTFFVTHEYTNYSMINELWRKGHEIALHSMTHSPYTEYWVALPLAEWQSEIIDQRAQMANFARIPPTDIKGMRAPFLQTGGDTMYTALANGGFSWECSRPTLSFRKPGMWPYTNDYQSTQDCQIDPCPKGEYKGFWTIPMLDMVGDDNEGCAMADACTPVPETEDGTYNLLMRNFKDHYDGTRAPFGIFAHAAWVNGTEDDFIWERRLGYLKFLDYLGSLPDVYIVSVSRALEWVKAPVNLAGAADFEHFKVSEKQNSCTNMYNCRYGPESTPFPTERYMQSCTPCPPVYPWIHDPFGRG